MLQRYSQLKIYFEKRFPELSRATLSYRRITKYVLSGGTAAVTNLVLLFLLTHYGGIYYLYSAVLSWVVSFFVSFILQKFWTFGKRNLEGARRELLWYFGVAGVSLLANTVLLYVFVDYLHIHYLISQIILGLAAAIVTYNINKFYIFTHRSVEKQP